MPSVAANVKNIPCTKDTITALLPWNPYKGRPSGHMPGKSFAGSEYEPTKFPKKVKFFRESEHEVHDLRSLGETLWDLADAAECMVVRGKPFNHGVIRRVAKEGKEGQALRDQPRYWAMLDMDSVPNPYKIDPVREPDRALQFVRSLLPIEIALNSHLWEWSSSAGLPGTEGLRVHLWIWLHTPLGPGGLKSLLERMNKFVQRRLEECGEHVDPTSRPLDWVKIPEPQQPHFVARPRFTDGAVDPFPGDRRRGGWWLKREFIELATLEAELAADEALCPGTPGIEPRKPKEKKAKAERVAQAKEARAAAGQEWRLPVTEPEDRPAPVINLIPLAATRRLMEARNEILAAPAQDARPRDEVGFRQRCIALYVRRALAEIVVGTQYRVQLGANGGRWARWHAEGGIPEGARSNLFCIVASLVVEALPDGWPLSQVRAEIRSVGRLVVAETWLDEEWFGEGYDEAVMDRYTRRGLGEKSPVHWQGKPKEITYGYSAPRIIDEFAFSHEEAAALDFRSLAPKSLERVRERRAQGQMSADEFQAARTMVAREDDAYIAREMQAGLSIRAIAEKLHLSKSKVATAVKRLRETPMSQADVEAALQADAAIAQRLADAPAAEEVAIEQPTRPHLVLVESAPEQVTHEPVAETMVITERTDPADVHAKISALNRRGIRHPQDIAKALGLTREELWAIQHPGRRQPPPPPSFLGRQGRAAA